MILERHNFSACFQNKKLKMEWNSPVKQVTFSNKALFYFTNQEKKAQPLEHFFIVRGLTQILTFLISMVGW